MQHQPKSVRVGIVSFSDNAFIVQAPTTDQDAVLAAIDRLYPQRGTAIGRGLQTSLNAIMEVPDNTSDGFGPPRDTNPFGSGGPSAAPSPTPVPQGTFNSAVVVLLTDGENNGPWNDEDFLTIPPGHKIAVRYDFSPVSRPIQNGELVESASRCGRK